MYSKNVMRLTERQISAIIKAFDSRLNDFELSLFGSRTDDNKKGGDIDLLLLTQKKIDLQLKWQIRREIEESIGEQKIDIINFTFNDNHPFTILRTFFK